MSKIAQDRDVAYSIANLSSLFTVCALAIEGADDYADHIRKSAIQDIKHVLEWGAVLALDVCYMAEGEAEGSGKRQKGGAL